jgi:hypothetical protein
MPSWCCKGYRRDIDSYSAFYENDHTTPTGLAGYLADSIRENDGGESPARFVGRVDGDGFRDIRNALAG